MWAPDVHKVKPFSALSQLLTMFGALAVFSYGVYNIQAPAPAVRTLMATIDEKKRSTHQRRDLSSQLPRSYPHDGLVQALSGTNDEQYAVCLVVATLSSKPPELTVVTIAKQARTDSANVVEE